MELLKIISNFYLVDLLFFLIYDSIYTQEKGDFVMKLLNFKEFRENSMTSEVTLGDYLTYLDGQKAEINELMSMPIPLDEDIISELQANLDFIDKLEEIINGNQKSIVIQSIDKLSLEELQSLYDNKLDEYNTEMDTLNELLDETKKNIDQAKEDYENKLRSEGYAREYYEADDTSVFFDSTVSTFDYVGMILSQDELDETELKNAIATAIDFETKYPTGNDYSSITESEKLHCMIEGIVSLFVKCHKLNKMVSNKTEYIVNSLLSESGIRKIIVEYFGKDLTNEVFLDMQNSVRENTLFFKGLPEEVQNNLRRERFCGDCFKGLDNYYCSLHSEEVYVPFESDDLIRLYEEQQSINNDISLVTNKIEVEKQFIQDDERLRDFLKSQIAIDDSDVPTIAKLDNFVETTQDDKEADLRRINEVDYKMDVNTKYITRLEEILDYPEYSQEEDEELEEDILQSSQIMDLFVDVESARLDQIKIMIDAERALEELEKV